MNCKKYASCLFTVACATSTLYSADLRLGLVSYWPLDEISQDLTTTPDVVTGNHFLLGGIDQSVFVPAKRGNGIEFNGIDQYAYFTDTPEVDSGLPVFQARRYSVAFWVKGVGTGQNDRRMFSESSSINTDPLLNIGTHNAGTDGTVDIFVRNSGTQVNHAHSPGVALDGEWHHITWTDEAGNAKLYIDGVLNASYTYVPGPSPLDTTSIGAIVRDSGNNIGAYFAGTIDDVAVWERVLTPAEVQEVATTGIQTPVPSFPPTFTTQPIAATNGIIGKSLTLEAGVSGTRPLSFQWQKDGTAISGATSPILMLSDLESNDAGAYALVAQNAASSVTSVVAQVTVSAPPPPNLTNGLVAYWPLNEIQGVKTPDLISGYDLNVVNLTENDVVPGKVGNAFSFVGSRSTLLERVHSPGEDLPINKHPAFTISIWTMVDGNGQNDLRVFSEGNTAQSNPLFNIGTHNTGGGPEADFYLRHTGWTTIDHVKSIAGPFDGTWHHIAFVQEEDGSRVFYVDGVLDDVVLLPRPLTVFLDANNTTVGGILRSSRTHFVTGVIDDVALWKRALSTEEVGRVISQGVPVAGGTTLPLAVRSFTSDYPTVVKGQNVTLRWDVTKDVAVTVDQGVGNVLSNTVTGIGSVSIPVNQDTTYTLTLTRGNETTSATVSVKVIEGVQQGWQLLENFQTYSAGQLANKGSWANPEGTISAVDLGVNHVLGFNTAAGLAALSLKSLDLKEGQKATLFFRVYAPTNNTGPVAVHVGLTEKAIRGSGDFSGDNVGPYIRFERLDTETDLIYGAYNGLGAALDTGVETLPPGTVHNIWIDVENDLIENGDKYSIYIAREGQANRTLVFDQYLSNRNPEGTIDLGRPLPDLVSVFVAAIGAQGADALLLDDFYLSSGNAYNSSVPVPASPFVMTEDNAPISVASATYNATAQSFTLSWNSQAGASYIVEKSTNLAGGWTQVATGYPAGGSTGATTSYTDTAGNSPAAFYRIRR